MRRTVLFILALTLIFIYPLSVLIQHKDVYFSGGYSKRYEKLKKNYYSSQYADKNHKIIITDEQLEAFAGGIFLTGINPILIHHDQPPLGRYIISLSIWLFDNEKTIPILLLLTSAFGIYLISLQVIKNKLLALVPFGIFINQMIFINKFLFAPLLEPIQFPFIIFAIYFFIVGVKRKQYLPWFAFAAIAIGFVISVRYFILGAVLANAFILYLYIHKKFKMLFALLCTLSISLAILLLSYLQTFKAGYSLMKVLGIQKYIFYYHKSAFTEPFSYWDLLFFNRWHTWWGERAIQSDSQWSILWPISVMIIIMFLILVPLKRVKLNPAESVLLCWLGLYSLMLSVGYTSTRYFLPIIPFLYILATGFIIKIFYLYFSTPVKESKHDAHIEH